MSGGEPRVTPSKSSATVPPALSEAGDEGMAKIIAKSNIHGELLRPEEVAAAVVWLGSDHAGMVNGQSLVVDGGGLVR